MKNLRGYRKWQLIGDWLDREPKCGMKLKSFGWCFYSYPNYRTEVVSGGNRYWYSR